MSNVVTFRQRINPTVENGVIIEQWVFAGREFNSEEEAISYARLLAKGPGVWDIRVLEDIKTYE